MTKKNQSLTKLADHLKPHVLKIEIITVALALISIGLKASNISSASYILILSLSTLAAIYYISASSSMKQETLIMENFINKLAAYSYSIAIVGVLFVLQDWKGGDNMIFVSSAILLFISIYSITKTKNLLTAVKSGIFLSVALGIYFVMA